MPRQNSPSDDGAAEQSVRETGAAQSGHRGNETPSPDILYAELRGIARRMMRSERRDHTLQPTALVNELWLKLAADQQRAYVDRDHFLSLAAKVMRQILLDHARLHMAQRRRPDADALARLKAGAVTQNSALEMVALDKALERLSQQDGRLAKIFELRCFGELSVEETAALLELSPTTVKREWRMARALLLQELTGSDHVEPR